MRKNRGVPGVKICGLTDPMEAEQCARLGADAIGLVFYSKSPRAVSMETAAAITRAVPKGVMTTGVFVDEGFDAIVEIATACSLTAVQLHGGESPDLVKKLAGTGLLVIKALFAKKEPLLDKAHRYTAASALLVEYGKGVLPGGNAETWNWELARTVTTDQILMLAGGLDPDNVKTAVSAARPGFVDVSSGVESAPGKKDLARVKAFIAAVHGPGEPLR